MHWQQQQQHPQLASSRHTQPRPPQAPLLLAVATAATAAAAASPQHPGHLRTPRQLLWVSAPWVVHLQGQGLGPPSTAAGQHSRWRAVCLQQVPWATGRPLLLQQQWQQPQRPHSPQVARAGPLLQAVTLAAALPQVLCSLGQGRVRQLAAAAGRSTCPAWLTASV
jgi:hypothetical protein